MRKKEMKKYNEGLVQLLVLGLVLIQLVPITEGAPLGYLGCAAEDRRNRIFCMNPAQYDPTALTIEVCQQACASWDYFYAGLTAGRYCFCSLVEPAAYEVDDTNCQEACTGSADKCGGVSHVSVYKAPIQTTGFRAWQDPDVKITRGGQATFSTTYFDASDSMKYAFDYGSGLSDWNATDVFTKSFALPGTHTVNACAVDEAEQVPSVCYADEVVVVSGAADLTLECPIVEATHNRVLCNASVWAGTSMQATLDYGDGFIDTFDLPDSRWFSAGNVASEHTPAVGTAAPAATVGTLYALPHAPFQHDGKMASVEFYADVAGAVDILVMSPACADYCFEDNSCNPACGMGEETCSGPTSAFCPQKEQCVNPSSLATCAGAPAAFAALTGTGYTVTWKQTITAVVGYNYYELTAGAEHPVARGDIIGYHATVGKIGGRLDTSDTTEDWAQVVASPAVGAAVADSWVKTSTDASIFLRGIAATTILIHIERIYTRPDIYTVALSVDSLDVPGPLNLSADVIIQYGINHVLFEHDEYVCTNDSYFYALQNHTGSNVTYFWTWGDGNEENTTLRDGLYHTFTATGRYNISVFAENDLTDKENDTYVMVEDCIRNMSVDSVLAPVFTDHPFTLHMSSGSHYECLWEWGDGETNNTDVYSTPIGSTITHMYKREGMRFDFRCYCWNNVSNGEFTMRQAAMYPVWNIQLEKKGAKVGSNFEIAWRVDHGTNATYTLWFDGEFLPTVYTHALLRGATAKLASLPLGNHNVTINGYNLVSNVTEDFMFSIESPVIGATSKAYENFGEDEPFVEILTGQEVTFNMSLVAGTSVKVTWNFKDGSPIETYQLGQGMAWPPNGFQARTHNFTTPGCYFVEVTIANNFDIYTFNHRVCVYNKVDCLVLESDSPRGFENLVAPATLHFTSTCHAPTLAQVTFDFGDGSALSVPKDCGLLTDKFKYPHNYLALGTYQVTAYVANPISAANYTTSILVVEPVSNLRIHVNPSHSAVGTPVEVCISMEKGNQVSIDWDFTTDGAVDHTAPRTGTTAYDYDCFTTTYGTIGTKNISVEATNPLGSTTVTYNHEAQYPVLDAIAVESNAPKPFSVVAGSAIVTFTANWDVSQQIPTDAKVYWKFGDDTESAHVPFPAELSTVAGYRISHTYNFPGHHIAHLVVYNLASSMEFEVLGGCYVLIDGLETTPLQVRDDSLDKTPQVGIGPDENQFSVDFDVLFDMKWTEGTVVKYMIEAVHKDGLAVQICNSSDNPVPNLFTLSGEWDVNITAWNPLSSDSIQKTIYVGDTMKGLMVTDHNLQVKKLKDYIVDISFEQTAPDMCVLVDFGDLSTTTEDVFLYSNVTNCPQYPGIPIQGPITNPMKAVYKYKQNGQYTVNVTAGNFLFTQSKTLTTTISNAKCKRPVLSIYNQRPNIYDPAVFLRVDDVVQEGTAVFDCKETLKNIKKWTVQKLNAVTGAVEKTIDLNSDQVLGSDAATLLIKSQFLEQGLFGITFTVTMDPSFFPKGDIFSSSLTTYVTMVNTPLQPGLVEGRSEKVTRGFGQTMLLQPEKFSFDPDVHIGEPQEFDSLELFCRQIDEEYPVDASGKWDTSNPQTPYTVPQLAVLTSDNGGCFRKGPGPVKLMDGELSFNTRNMHENETYQFDLVIKKDIRTARASLILDVVQGNPPSVEIQCVQPGQCGYTERGIRINPGRLALYAKCIEYCEGETQWDWTAFHEGIEANNWIEYLLFKDHVTADYGVHSPSIAIQKSLFDWGFSVNSDLDTYRMRVAGTKKGETRPGIAYTVVEVNTPPKGGVCSVTPSQGLPIDTKFSFICTNWTDDRAVEEVQFFSVDPVYSSENSLGTERSGELFRTLPMGNAKFDYNHHMWARVVDDEGASVVVDMGFVKVTPVPIAEAQATIDNLLNNPDNNDMLKVAEEADLAESAQTFTQIASVLNTLSADPNNQAGKTQPGATPYGPVDEYDTNQWDDGQDGTKTDEELQEEYEQRRSDYGLLRTQMMQALGGLTVTDMSDLGQVVTAAAVVSSEVDQMNRNSQIECEKLVHQIGDFMASVQNSVPQNELTSACTNLFTLIGNCMEAATLSVEAGSLEDTIQTMDTIYYYYDTDKDSKDDWLIDLSNMADQQHSLQSSSNVKHQKAINYDTIGGLTESIGKILGILLATAVAGEDQLEIFTPRLSATVRKTAANNMMPATIQGRGGSQVLLPDWCELINRDLETCDNSQLLSFGLWETPENTFSHIKDGDNVPTLTSILNIDFFDEAGNKIVVNNSSPPIELLIPNDRMLNILPHENVTADIPDNHFLFYHSFTVDKECTSLQIELIPGEDDVQLLAVLRRDAFPEVNTSSMNYGMDYVLMSPVSMKPAEQAAVLGGNKYMMYISQDELDCWQGKMYIGIRQLEEDEWDHYSLNKNNKKPRTPKQGTGKITSPYQLRVAQSGCYYLTPEQTWSREGLWTTRESNAAATKCYTTHLSTFSGSFAVAPNAIDWDFVFSNADFFSNPTLYITEIIIAVVYIIVAIWARHYDRKIAFKLGSTPLPDNNPNDKYLYEILVKTGSKKAAGTDSQVSFIISGEMDETDVRMFADKKRKVLRRSATDSFLMATPRPLGSLQYMRLWHDNTGKGKYQGWYCSYVIISDLQTKEKFVFLVNNWFAVEEDDGQVDRVVPIAGPEQMVEFKNLFAHTTRKNFSDEHLWFSVVARPAQSRFSCLQRVSCCLLLLFTSMLANAMFYERVPDDEASNLFEFGPFALSPQQLYVGFIVNLIVFPINFLLVFLFRRSRPRTKRPSRLKAALQAHAKASGGNMQLSSTNDMRKLIEERDSSSPEPSTSQSPPPQQFAVPMRPDTGLAQQTMAIPIHSNSHANSSYHGLKEKKKKPFTLPWWVRLIAWMLLWAATLTCAAFVTFYGIMFGDIKCKKWISSLFISFITSVFLTQPIKVFLTALLFSLFFKKADLSEGDEEDEEEIFLKPDEEWMHSMPNDPDYAWIGRERKVNYKPPDPDALLRARATRMKELKMFDIIREIVFYAFFLWVLLVISYGFRDPKAFYMKQSMEQLFLDRPVETTGGVRNIEDVHPFEDIYTFDDFWDWLELVAVPNIRADRWYNGRPPIGQRGFVGDRVGRIMGYATLRQLRVRPNKCKVEKNFRALIDECNIPYDMGDETDENYNVGWTPLPDGVLVNESAQEYIYRTADELDGYPYWGSQAVYSGGGYVLNMTGSLQVLLEKVAKLKKDMWLDRYTRAIFMEFTVYNPFTNLFGIVTLCTEVVVSGGMAKYKRIEPMNLLGYYQEGFGFQIFCEILYVIFIIIFIIKETRNMYKQGKGYFKMFWNWCELFIIILSISAVVIYFYRYIMAKELVEEFRISHGNKYMKFQYVAYWNEMLMYLAGWLVFLASIKFIKLLRFNKRMGMLAATLRTGAKPLGYFSIIFFVMFAAFAQFFYLIYYHELENFRTLIHAMQTCQQMLVGKFNFRVMEGSSPVLGPLVFFCYVVTVYYILINMFLTILNEAFATVRADITLQSDEYEMVSFIMKRFKQWSGLQSVLGNKKSKSQGDDFKKFATYEKQVNEFPERMDRLVNIISKSYYMSDTLDAIFDPARPQDGKSAMKSMMKQVENQQYNKKKGEPLPGTSKPSRPPLDTQLKID